MANRREPDRGRPLGAGLTVDQHKANIKRRLRKRDAKDINTLAEELDVPRQALARPLAGLVADGEAVRTEQKGRRVVYTKP